MHCGAEYADAQHSKGNQLRTDANFKWRRETKTDTGGKWDRRSSVTSALLSGFQYLHGPLREGDKKITRHKTKINNECRRQCEMSTDLCFSFFANFSYWLITLYLLKPSGHYMYRTVVTICTTRFNIQQFYVLPTQCICVFCVDIGTNRYYFPIH